MLLASISFITLQDELASLFVKTANGHWEFLLLFCSKEKRRVVIIEVW